MNNDALPRGLTFAAGVATGLALGYYLQSEKGAALRERLAGHWNEALEDLGDKAREQLDQLLEMLNAVMEKGLNYAEILEENLEQNLSEASDEARQVAEDVEITFESGMDKARALLRQKFLDAGLTPED